MLGIGNRVVNWEARVEIGGAPVESAGTVPNVCAALCGDDDGGGCRSSGVSVLLCGTRGKFLDGVR